MRLGPALLLCLAGCTAAHQATDPIPDPCVGLEPESFACAQAWLATLDHLHCLWEPACTGAVASEAFCDVYDPAVGSWSVTEAERHRLAFEEGRLRFDPAGPRCLLEHTRRCEATFYDDPCPSFWVPTRSHVEGDACDNRYECGEGLYCTDATRSCGAAHGTCRRAGLEGEACGSDAPPCSDGLVCGEGQCVRVLARDASGTEDAPCNVATRATTGVWTWRDCAEGFGCFLMATGDRCRAIPPCDATSCDAYNTCLDGTCVPVLPVEGEACRGGAYGLCAWGTFDLMCNAERRCERSTRRLGALCVPGWAPCLEGVCRQEPADGGPYTYRCMPPAEAGERCSADGDCRSHACCDHVCAP